MDKYITLFLIFLSIGGITSCAQQMKSNAVVSGVPDSTYKNVIEIKDKDLVTDGKSFLFDRSIPANIEAPVVFVSAKVPVNLLMHIYPENKRLTVVTPNWKFYDETSGQSNIGEPIASSIIYQLNRENDHVIKDSLVIMGGFPKMEMIEDTPLGENTHKIYLTEHYGSICCPRDPQWDIKPNIDSFISDFEKKHRVKIKDTYLEYTGKEGEKNYYFSLSGLSIELKLKFLVERTALLADQRLNPSGSLPLIFTAVNVLRNDRMRLR